MKSKYLILPCLSLVSSAAIAQTAQPNIIVILTDDLGFSDLGSFGGEINTPVLDNLAEQGVRFTQMYNSARSCPSRASMLTGLYPHQAGLGHMDTHPRRKDFPVGYSGFRSDNNVTIAEVLKENGYYTAMSGKWHLGPIQKPTERGFEDYYGLYGGFTTFWDKSQYIRLPEGSPTREYNDDEFYATDAITDYAIDFVEKANSQSKPFFLYLAYNAPHFPLHAPKEATDKYMDVYLKGWDKIREERNRKVRELGLIQGNPQESPRGVVPGSMFMEKAHPIPAWENLTTDQQKDLARRMAIYAAMVDIMDENIGRLLKTLEENNQLHNTFILFMSDNGACAEWHEFGFDFRTGLEYHTHVGEELDQMGLKGTYHHYGTGWANVCNAPFSLYKHFAHEGGISTPGIMWWGNNISQKGSIDHQPCHFVDVMTTCVDLASANYPLTYNENNILPMEGVSLVPMTKGESIEERPIFAEHEGNRMVRRGDWKLVAAHYKGHDWELYNIREDRTEQNNLANQYPDKVADLEALYFEWAKRCHVEPFPQMWNPLNPKTQFEIYKER